MCDGGHGRRGGARGERAKPVTCATGMRATTMGHLLDVNFTNPSSPFSRQGKLVESKSYTLSFGDGEKVESFDDSKVVILQRGESLDSRLGRMENEQHARDMTGNVGRPSMVMAPRPTSQGMRIFAVTGHNDNGGALSHGRENGGAGCALGLEHRKMVRLLGRRCNGATERRSKNSWKRTSREGGDGERMIGLTKMI
ncbi:4-coumarate--CoA ligase-like 6 [Sesbania bispinosa]|nr:4-coumarate--CoA ligase-like 6 [Sesbania bispinosa]